MEVSPLEFSCPKVSLLGEDQRFTAGDGHGQSAGLDDVDL